ncbi:TPA: restriction endonuclease subunit S [Vibrio parahaemolyticus]
MSILPKNWIETDIGSVAKVISGGTPKASDDSNFAKPGTGYAWLTPADLSGYKRKSISNGKRDLTQKGLDSSSAKLMPEGSVLFSSRAPIGYVAIAENEISTNQGFKSFVFDERVYPSYAYYYLKSIRNLAESWGTGTTFKELSGAKAKQLPFILAPYDEQLRIADRLDSIFEKLEIAKSRLEKVPLLLKYFRMSVLSAAVSGELTEKWRDANNAGNWEHVSLKQVGKGFNYGSSAKSKKEGSVPVLRMGNLQDGKLDWSDLVYTSDEKEIEKYKLEAGDVLFNRTNSPELVGKTSIYRGEREAIFAGYLIKVQGTERLNSEYLNIQLNSPHARDYCWQVKTDGVSQSNINAQKLKAYEFNVPSVEEQEEIVRVVSELLSKSDLVRKQYEAAKLHIDKLTQSILARAFRGELFESFSDKIEQVTQAQSLDVIDNKPTAREEPVLERVNVSQIQSTLKSVDDNSELHEDIRASVVKSKTQKKTKEALIVDLESESLEVRDVFRDNYKKEIGRAKELLFNATFSVEQFRSITEFKGSYDEFKALIMNLLKGIPSISEPLLEVESWDDKSGDYLLRMVKGK